MAVAFRDVAADGWIHFPKEAHGFELLNLLNRDILGSAISGEACSRCIADV